MSNKRTYAMQYDGLSTFLNIAAVSLSERNKCGDLSSHEAIKLQEQASLAMNGFGLVIEALALERMECSQGDNHATGTALLFAGRMMREMADISETLADAMAKPQKPKALQAA